MMCNLDVLIDTWLSTHCSLWKYPIELSQGRHMEQASPLGPQARQKAGPPEEHVPPPKYKSRAQLRDTYSTAHKWNTAYPARKIEPVPPRKAATGQRM